MALVMVMILLVVLSVMATSLMFLAQTETWSSLNYRLMTQARYGAEAGVNQAANYLLNTYTPPATTGTDLLSNYNLHATGVTPFEGDNVGVTYNNKAVVLHSTSGSANYPVSATETAFKNATTGSLTAGNTTINYTAHATLLSMTQVTPYGTATPVTIQTWRITGDAAIAGAATAQTEVSSILERQVTPVFTYAAFAASPNCAAMTFGGGGTTGSYDSSAVVGGVATTSASGGNVGTNGNLTTNGQPTTINGSLSTPRTGVGACVNGSNVTAWTDNNGTVTGGVIELAQPVVYPVPVVNPPGSLDISLSGATCPSGTSAIPGCIANGSTHDIYIPPGSYGNIQISGQVNLHFSQGTYNINSFQESGNNTSLVIDSLPPITTPSWTTYPSTAAVTPVILDVTGSSSDPFTGSVITLTGNSVQNAGLNPMNFQMLYAGSGSVSLKGNSQAAGLLYAPNASFSFAGGSTWYGAVVGQTMTDMGGAAIYYDRRLNNSGFTLGPNTLDTFSWKKY
jgi:hypothetical protein